MEKRKFNHTELKQAIDLHYWALSTKDALDLAAVYIGVSAPTVKKWYYGQETPPRWHLKAIDRLIKRSKKYPTKP